MAQGLPKQSAVHKPDYASLEGMGAAEAEVIMSDLYDDLAGLGFEAEHIEEALQVSSPACKPAKPTLS